MDDRTLERSLQTIGKACFARYFELFVDRRLDAATVARRILESEAYAATATRRRVSAARRIIDCNRGIDALENVAASNNVDDAARQKAHALLDAGFPTQGLMSQS
ncbi:MAG: hypothetical protein KF904_18630 [Rhodoblastus sp.]|nr:hypothetical protein [Rhodoblastus sp.]